jgi:hypothetical protein
MDMATTLRKRAKRIKEHTEEQMVKNELSGLFDSFMGDMTKIKQSKLCEIRKAIVNVQAMRIGEDIHTGLFNKERLFDLSFMQVFAKDDHLLTIAVPKMIREVEGEFTLDLDLLQRQITSIASNLMVHKIILSIPQPTEDGLGYDQLITIYE